MDKNITEPELNFLYNSFDDDNNGTISLKEFLAVILLNFRLLKTKTIKRLNKS